METTVIDEFRNGIAEISDGVDKSGRRLTELDGAVGKLKEENQTVQAEMNKIRRLISLRGSLNPSGRTPGLVSDEFARSLTYQLILQCAKSGRLDLLCQSAATRDALFNSAREF